MSCHFPLAISCSRDLFPSSSFGIRNHLRNSPSGRTTRIRARCSKNASAFWSESASGVFDSACRLRPSQVANWLRLTANNFATRSAERFPLATRKSAVAAATPFTWSNELGWGGTTSRFAPAATLGGGEAFRNTSSTWCSNRSRRRFSSTNRLRSGASPASSAAPFIVLVIVFAMPYCKPVVNQASTQESRSNHLPLHRLTFQWRGDEVASMAHTTRHEASVWRRGSLLIEDGRAPAREGSFASSFARCHAKAHEPRAASKPAARAMLARCSLDTRVLSWYSLRIPFVFPSYSLGVFPLPSPGSAAAAARKSTRGPVWGSALPGRRDATIWLPRYFAAEAACISSSIWRWERSNQPWPLPMP